MSRRPTLCLDFDGVLHSYSSGWQGADKVSDPPVDGAMEFLVQASEVFSIAIHSSRNSKSGSVEAIKSWLRRYLREHLRSKDVQSSYRNIEGEVERILMRIHYPSLKPAAHVILDDRAMTFTGQWPSIDELQTFKSWTEA